MLRQEGTNTTLTTCTKMTEEEDRRYGVNGNSGSKGANEDVTVHNTALTGTGGRLKFFKDGKFILELVRGCAREGERAGWVSVPRKTFWPPAAAPAAPTTPPAAHHTAALSVSDDNSSVQSSPWQRDHCWKQTAPRRNISKELAMYYCRPTTLHTTLIDTLAKRKRRRPYDTTLPENLFNGGVTKRHLMNGVCEKKTNGEICSPERRSEDVIDGSSTKTKSSEDVDRWTDYDREKYYHMKLKKPYQYRKLKVYKKTRSAIRRKELTKVITKLYEVHERLPTLAAPVNAKLANCRQEHMIVSPRKRILRELERVTLEDQSTKRRAKTVPALSTASYPPSPGPSHTTSRSHNGSAHRKDTSVSKNVSSYSIHSLLSIPDEIPTRRSPEAKRSPHPTSSKTESPSSVNSPDLSPSPDGYRYRYSALDSPTPPPPQELARYRPQYVSPAPAGYGRQWTTAAPSAHPVPQYRGGGGGGGSGVREEWPRELPYVYGYGYVPPHLYRAPAPLWMHYAVPPSPWAPLALPLVTDHIPKDEPTSDLPLNLSKH